MEAVKDSLGITDVENDIGEFNNASILTPLEKKNMADGWKVIQEEYKKNIELAKAFGLYTDDKNISNDDQTVTDYINSYHTLSQQIGKCGLNDLSSSASIDTRIYNDINNYHTANINLANRISEESKKLSEKAYTDAVESLNNFISGDYKNFTAGIQAQVDGKSETYYMAAQPYENHLDVKENSSYDKLVGDLWYDSDAGSKKTYVYTKSPVSGSSYNYEWKEMEVPAEIFDMADGKTQLFTRKPENYNKNDMWLVGDDYTPPIKDVKTGYILTAEKENLSYADNDWVLSIRYTDDTVAMQAVSDNILTPSEKRDLLNEINSIKASYAKYSSICSALDISYSGYTSAYHTLVQSMSGNSSVYRLDVPDNTILTSGQVINFKTYFNNYYAKEADIIKCIQDSTNHNISKAQESADKAQKDASKALGVLDDIASDSKITPAEKLQLLDKFNTVKSSHNEIVSAYGEAYKNASEYTSYISAYNSLYGMLCPSPAGILADMADTYDMGAAGNYSRTSYNDIISAYHSHYQSLVNKITKDMQDSIDSVSGIADKVQQSLGWTTEIDEKSVISPYMEGGYLNITAPAKGSVVIDPLGIKNSSYIFGVYNPENKVVMGVDASGNGVFEGKVIAKLGNIGGWGIDAYRLYMGNTGMSSYGGCYAFWAGETNGACGTINSNAKFRVGHDGHLLATNADISGKINADDGKIGGWNLNSSSIYRNSEKFGASGGMYFGTNGLSIGSTFKVSAGGTLTSGSLSNYVTLDNGALRFYSDGKATAVFSDTVWKDTSVCGTAVHLEDYSKFVSFGRKPEGGNSYSTTLLLNYGLNPDGRTEGIISYGSVFSAGSITTGSSVSSDGSITTGSSYILNKPGGIRLTSGRVNAWNGTAWGLNNSESGTGLYVFGNIGCSGTKERIIQTKHYGAVELNAYETATPYFGDIGSGECDGYGLCYIYLDEIFKETILAGCGYYVFLQPYGSINVYPVEKNADYFIVKGSPLPEI